MSPASIEELKAKARAKEIGRYSDLKLLGFATDRATLRRHIATEGFPEPIVLGPNSVGWVMDEVRAWFAARPRGQAPQPLRTKTLPRAGEAKSASLGSEAL
jgi:predicted DNA-binding transcriptional regulator AlpA